MDQQEHDVFLWTRRTWPNDSRPAVEARTELASDMVLMARTNAMTAEGLDAAVDRCHAHVQAGADMLFLEACPSLEHYRMYRP